jgi:hypothetical protein
VITAMIMNSLKLIFISLKLSTNSLGRLSIRIFHSVSVAIIRFWAKLSLSSVKPCPISVKIIFVG